MSWRKRTSAVAAGPFLSVFVATVALAYFASGGVGTGEASSGTLQSPSPVTAASQGASARVSWTTVPTPSGTSTDVTYSIDRSGDDGSTWLPTNNTCGGRQPRTTAACDDVPPVSGLYRYRVTAHFRTWTSTGMSSAVAIVALVPDNTPPTSTITFPTAGTYTQAAYLNGCSTPTTGDVCGTASDPGLTASGVSKVRVSIQRSSDSLYWNGMGAWVPLATWNDAAGTTSWSYAFSASNLTTGVTYTLRSQAIDNRDGVQVTPDSKSFTFDGTAPTATDIQSANGAGTAGLIDSGDRIVYTFSEPMDPNTIVAGWTGSSRSVTVTFHDFDTTDAVTVDGTNLGFVLLSGNPMNSTRSTSALMVMSGSTITLTLTSGPPGGQVNTVASSTMRWSPSTSARDSAGNNMSSAAVTQSGSPKQNF